MHPRPQIFAGIDTGNTHRRGSQTVLYQVLACITSSHILRVEILRGAGAQLLLALVGAKAIQSELVAQWVGDTELLTQLLPEILFRTGMSRNKKWSKPQTEERQNSWSERKSRRGQRVHRAEPSVKILPVRDQAPDPARLLECRAARRWRTEFSARKRVGNHVDGKC